MIVRTGQHSSCIFSDNIDFSFPWSHLPTLLLSRLMLHFALLSETAAAFYSFKSLLGLKKKLPAVAVSHESWEIGLKVQRLWTV